MGPCDIFGTRSHRSAMRCLALRYGANAVWVLQASRLCTVRQARIQLATVLSLAVLYNAPKFGEARVQLDVDPADNSTWLMPVHTALGVSRLYNVIYGNVCYTLFLLALPLVVLASLNVRLIREVKHSSTRSRTH